MISIRVDTTEGTKTEKVYGIHDFPYERFSHANVSLKTGKNPVIYLELSAAFDIETTNITEGVERPYAFMYHWQFCIEKSVVFGRRWEEFTEFLRRLHDALYLASNRRLVVFIHNAAFEFQFMRRFLNIEGGFYKAERKPLKVVINGFEFRDSYALSNMSLSKFCENTKGVTHYKLIDTYDYRKLRTPATHLTEEEMAYCYNDVRGLCECITEYRKHDKLAKMPMTSTGFVRRDFRQAMKKKNLRQHFENTRLTADLYNFCKAAFRGGDTHANIYWVGDVAENINSYDISSSYPFQMMVRKYPMGKFFRVNPDRLKEYLDGGRYALLIHAVFQGIRYTGTCGNPYISIAKCKHKQNVINDNGRVLAADYIDTYITDIDYNIIEHDYRYEHIYIESVYASYYAPLPNEFKDTLMEYFRGKTKLKGDPDHEYEYMKSKNKLNSAYGMTVTDIAKPVWRYENGEYIPDEIPLEERLDKFYKSRNSFLPYQWGVWVTCWARLQLREMLWKVGADVIYCDTDSIKYAGDHSAEFEEKNKELQKLADAVGAFADDRNGRKVYMGLWDHDAEYSKFCTLGAKKYCYQYKGDDSIYSTIAGVSKKAGKEFFTCHGFQAFKNGTVIKDSGHLVAYYNDDEKHVITVDGCTFTTGANTALVDGDYTIGQTAEYLDLLEKALANESLLY